MNSSEKYKELLKISDPKKVLKNAKKLFGPDVYIDVSTRKNKKYMIFDDVNNKFVHFGQFEPPMEDFTKHKNKQRRSLHLARATKIKGNWKNNPYSANNLSINLLW